MRQFFILLTASLALTACSSDQQDQTEKLTSSTIPTDTFPIDYVRQVSIDRKAHYNLDSLDLSKLKTIDTVFFKKWFDKKKTSDNTYTIEFDPFSRYYFFDFKDLERVTLFSIIYDDEVGYDNMFHFTFDKEKRQITQIDFLASRGGDGGHGCIGILDYNKSGDNLIHTSISIFDSDFDKGYTREYDSSVTKIEFNPEKTTYSILDSLSRLDTIWDKK